MANNTDISCTCWFLMELIIADIQENNKKIHRIISINFQKVPGAHTVIIQQRINNHANHIITHNGHSFFMFIFTLNYKLKSYITILNEKSNKANDKYYVK